MHRNDVEKIGGAGAPKYHGIVRSVNRCMEEKGNTWQLVFCPLDGDHPLRVLHRLLPHMKGVKERKRNKSRIVFVKEPNVALHPNEILYSEELEGSTKTCRNSLKKTS